MKIFVCMKQVPATTKVDIDPETGNLKRAGQSSRTNPYDLYALECALRIREKVGGTVTVITMGPAQAEAMIRDAYSMGADEGIILSDPKFAGSDVLATSYTISQGIRLLGGADLIIHCGDYRDDGKRLSELTGAPVEAVSGNCDGASRDVRIVGTPAGDIMVTHGHAEGVDYDLNAVLYAAEERGCRAVCFGHTHVSLCEDMNGIYVINPGSLTRPRDGKGGACALIQADEHGFFANLVYYDTLFPSGTAGAGAGTKGGFLRNMLNYSDRF